MQDGMLDAADILVDRHPVIDLFLDQRYRGARTAEAGEIPRAVDEGVAGSGFAPRRLAAGRTGEMIPGRMMVERIAWIVEADVVSQQNREGNTVGQEKRV